ncbi:MAG TPA: hypothetical protein VNG73_04485, partial [Gemmatimonadaceae bacterium]|nr:hypothetical protein [Gemmatimonadaceae bacterium]
MAVERLAPRLAAVSARVVRLVVLAEEQLGRVTDRRDLFDRQTAAQRKFLRGVVVFLRESDVGSKLD